MHDSDAKDLRPDISVIHIVGGTIHKPTIEDVRGRYHTEGVDENVQLERLLTQYMARGGMKIVHRRGVLIGEFKRAPARAPDVEELTTGDWQSKLDLLLQDAIEDTMRYCAIHFMIYSSSTSEVIALASAGPFWQWATIRREQVPNFDWITGLTLEGEENKRDNFKALFHHDHYLLTTPESDEQINKMRDVMYNLINTPQTYPTPTDFGFTLVPDEPKKQYFSL